MSPIVEPPSIIEELHKPTKGDEVIQKIEPAKVQQEDLRKILGPSLGKELIDGLRDKKEKEEKDIYASTIVKDGVEVLDVRAIPEKRVNKFGIPLKPGEENSLYGKN